MTSALIGYTGFVGSNLLRQGKFDDLYNSKNIENIRGKSYDRIVCAGAPGAKWIANENPDADRASIDRMFAALYTVAAKIFVLISTIDVLADHPYGQHRRLLEDYVSLTFSNYRIVRLPALFGPGLKKNVLYDLMHGHRLERINPNSWYQWYPVDWLSTDLLWIEDYPREITHLVTRPIETREIIERFFPSVNVGWKSDEAEYYNVHPEHSVFNRDDVLEKMGKFIEEERNGRTNDQRLLATADEGSRA